MKTAGHVTAVRECGAGVIVAVCESGLMSVWDVGKQTILCEVEAFTGSSTYMFLEVCPGQETLIALGYCCAESGCVSIYQLLGQKLTHISEILGQDEQVSALTLNSQGLFILWRGEQGGMRLDAVGLDTVAMKAYTVRDERTAESLLDCFVTDRDLVQRVLSPHRFSKQCMREAVYRITFTTPPEDLTNDQLASLIASLNPKKPEAENVTNFLETCKSIQSEEADSVYICSMSGSSDFPVLASYSDESIGLLVRLTSAIDIDSTMIEELCTRLLSELQSGGLGKLAKASGVPRLTLALALARMMRKRHYPMLRVTSLLQLTKIMKSLQEFALPPAVQSALIACMSPATISQLEQQIKALKNLMKEPKGASDLRREKWPAAIVTLVANSSLTSLRLKSQFALDCVLLTGWLKSELTEFGISEKSYTSALTSAAHLVSLSVALSSPASTYPSQLGVYSCSVTVLAALISSKSGKVLGSSEDFDPALLSGWLSHTVTRVVKYLVAVDDFGIPLCCNSLRKTGQAGAMLQLLEVMNNSAIVQYLKGVAYAEAGIDSEAKDAFCRGLCLLDRNDTEQFKGKPWCVLQPPDLFPAESILFKYYRQVTEGVQSPSLKGPLSISVFYSELPALVPEFWTHLFQVLLKLRRHADVFTLLVHHSESRLTEFVEIWLRELMLEGSVAALHILPLHPEILTIAIDLLRRMAAREAFDLLTTLCSPRYREQTSTIFQTVRNSEKPEFLGALSAHMALFHVALGCLQYRLAAWAMFDHYENIAKEANAAVQQEHWFLLFLQQEALLLAVTALNCLPEPQAWFLSQRTDEPRKLVARAEIQRLLCSIKRELDKVR